MWLMRNLNIFLAMLFLVGCVSNSRLSLDDRGKAVENYLNLAKGYINEGLVEKAVRPLDRALEIEPRSAEIYGLLGVVFQYQGESTEADNAFKKALSYNRSAAEVQNNYGSFLLSEGRLEEAYNHYKIAAEIISYEKRSRSFENMGVVAEMQGNDSLSMKNYEKSLRLNGTLVRARLNLAAILFENKEYSLSWSHYAIFIKQSKQNAKSLLLGIKLARASGDRSSAASYALRLEHLYPLSKEFKKYRSLKDNEY